MTSYTIYHQRYGIKHRKKLNEKAKEWRNKNKEKLKIYRKLRYEKAKVLNSKNG